MQHASFGGSTNNFSSPWQGSISGSQGWKVMDGKHIIIEGDAASALPALHAELAGDIDLVYIDPPYDHGDSRRGSQRLFAYDDRRGDDWGAYLADRLTLAGPLLNDRACVVVSIGHQRLHDAAAILAAVFADRHIATITVDTRGGVTDRYGIIRRAEYLLIAIPVGSRLGAPGFTSGEKRTGWGALTLTGFTGADYPNQVYPVFVDDSGRIVGAGPSLRESGGAAGEHVDRPDGTIAIWPITRHGAPVVWRLSRQRFTSHLQAGWVKAMRPRQPGNPQPWVIQYLTAGMIARIESGEVATNGRDANGAVVVDGPVTPVGAGVPTLWADPKYETRAGAERLTALIGHGHGFAYPKPVELIADVIRACAPSNNAAILDFFAGSGTTLDAIAQLNAADGGNRRGILIEQDRHVLDDILLPRVTAAGVTEPDVRRRVAHSHV